jgi:hypothetical protein
MAGTLSAWLLFAPIAEWASAFETIQVPASVNPHMFRLSLDELGYQGIAKQGHTDSHKMLLFQKTGDKSYHPISISEHILLMKGQMSDQSPAQPEIGHSTELFLSLVTSKSLQKTCSIVGRKTIWLDPREPAFVLNFTF